MYNTGEVQTFSAPVDGWYLFEVMGSAGGFGNVNNPSVYANGYGAYVKATAFMKKGTTLYVYVGQQASSSTDYGGSWNGGSGSPQSYMGTGHEGGAGGGATDIRLVKGTSNTQWDDITSLQSRILVAGGGGGAVSNCSGGNTPGHGGIYAGITSVNQNYNSDTHNTSWAGGGQQNKGGDAYDASREPGHNGGRLFTASGSFGRGGVAATCAGGGGGGWYGGGSAYVCGGGGGSSYVYDYSGFDTTYKSFQESLMPYPIVFQNVGLEGAYWNNEGYAHINLISQ